MACGDEYSSCFSPFLTEEEQLREALRLSANSSKETFNEPTKKSKELMEIERLREALSRKDCLLDVYEQRLEENDDYIRRCKETLRKSSRDIRILSNELRRERILRDEDNERKRLFSRTIVERLGNADPSKDLLERTVGKHAPPVIREFVYSSHLDEY